MESNSNTFVSFEQSFGSDGLKKGHLNLIVEDTHFELSPDDAEALLVQLAAACTEMRRSEEDETAMSSADGLKMKSWRTLTLPCPKLKCSKPCVKPYHAA